jgi:hypothetical protein
MAEWTECGDNGGCSLKRRRSPIGGARRCNRSMREPPSLHVWRPPEPGIAYEFPERTPVTSALTTTTLSLFCVLGMVACRAKERPASTEGAAVTEQPAASSQIDQVTAPEVVARFSIAGGNPTVPDADRSPRGMALEFRLPGGSLQHMTMINTPMFFATMPRTFLDKMLALKPDPATGKPNPEAVKAFAASHPDNTGQATFLAGNNPPPELREQSVLRHPYFQVHQSEERHHAGALALHSSGRRQAPLHRDNDVHQSSGPRAGRS